MGEIIDRMAQDTESSQAHGSKVFLKNNLAPYFTGELVQDFPFSYPPKNLG